METLDVFVADPVSKSFIRIIHGILVFFFKSHFRLLYTYTSLQPSNSELFTPSYTPTF